MALPFNPMSFVTPYTAVGTGHRGGGEGFANSMNQARQQKVSEGYLQNAQRQTDFSQKKYGEDEIDKAHQALLGAVASGDQDKIEAAANNMRVVGARYGVTIDEIRSDRAEANVAGQTSTAKKAIAEVGSEENPLDLDAYERDQAALKDQSRQAKGKYKPGESEAADSRIDAELQADRKAQAFTGGVRTPGGSLPAQAGLTATSSEMAPRTPGGSLPQPASAAEPAGASEAPLRGYTLRGPDGKTLYQVSPQDVIKGQRERVGGVFDNLPAEELDAGAVKEAKSIAMGLVGVLTPQQAVAKGLEHLEKGQQRRGALQAVEANHRPRFGGGGTGPAADWATGKQGAAMNQFSDEMDATSKIIMDKYKLPALNAADQQVRSAAAGLDHADNPASQKLAIKQIIKSMSGAVVTDTESRYYEQAAGIKASLENILAQWTGDEMSPQYVGAVKNVVHQWMALADHTRRVAAEDGGNYFESKVMGRAPQEVIGQGADGVYNFIASGGSVVTSGRPKRKPATPAGGVSEDDF